MGCHCFHLRFFQRMSLLQHFSSAWGQVFVLLRLSAMATWILLSCTWGRMRLRGVTWWDQSVKILVFTSEFTVLLLAVGRTFVKSCGFRMAKISISARSFSSSVFLQIRSFRKFRESGGFDNLMDRLSLSVSFPRVWYQCRRLRDRDGLWEWVLMECRV